MREANDARPTRFEGLSYRMDGPGLWRFVDEDGGRSVGPQYTTKAELLADLSSYAEAFCSGRLR